MNWIALAGLVLVVTGGSIDSPPPVETRLPDAVESFNLWHRFIAENRIDAALALTARVQDEEALRARYAAFSELMRKTGNTRIAFATVEDGDLAVVLCLDHGPEVDFIDIDPTFVLRDGGVWKILPIFRAPDRKIPGLSDEEAARVHALIPRYREAHDREKARLEEARKGD